MLYRMPEPERPRQPIWSGDWREIVAWALVICYVGMLLGTFIDLAFR